MGDGTIGQPLRLGGQSRYCMNRIDLSGSDQARARQVVMVIGYHTWWCVYPYCHFFVFVFFFFEKSRMLAPARVKLPASVGSGVRSHRASRIRGVFSHAKVAHNPALPRSQCASTA